MSVWAAALGAALLCAQPASALPGPGSCGPLESVREWLERDGAVPITMPCGLLPPNGEQFVRVMVRLSNGFTCVDSQGELDSAPGLNFDGERS